MPYLSGPCCASPQACEESKSLVEQRNVQVKLAMEKCANLESTNRMLSQQIGKQLESGVPSPSVPLPAGAGDADHAQKVRVQVFSCVHPCAIVQVCV